MNHEDPVMARFSLPTANLRKTKLFSECSAMHGLAKDQSKGSMSHSLDEATKTMHVFIKPSNWLTLLTVLIWHAAKTININKKTGEMKHQQVSWIAHLLKRIPFLDLPGLPGLAFR